jgi:purine-cytosine permease-like protein
MAYASGIVLLITFAWINWAHGLPADFLTRNAFNWPGFLGAISSGALWQIAYARYFSVGIASANAVNLYCGALSTLTFGQTLIPAWSPGQQARTIGSRILFGFALAAALLGKASFLVNYQGFILLLLYVLVPWTAINLVDYYFLRHGEYDVASPLYTGPIARAMGRIDLSWIVGLVITSPVYYWMAKRSQADEKASLTQYAPGDSQS